MKRRKLVKAVVLIIFLIFISSFIYIFTIISSAYKVDISALSDPPPVALKIYDKNDELITERSVSRYTAVTLMEVPEMLQKAVIAIEDKRFYEHRGVVLVSIFRSFARNLKAGGIVEGGSTITQQLAKNVFLSAERTYSRKLKEAVIAYRIDKEYSKDEILELYLNQIYLGEGSWGVQEASIMYFGKDVKDISLAQAAMIAALPKAPTHYSPLKDYEKALERRNLVLDVMFEQDIIDKLQHDAAINEKILLSDGKNAGDEDMYPSYVDYAIEEAIDRYGIDEIVLFRAGLNIYTNLDPKVQDAIETTYGNDSLFPEGNGKDLVQSAAISIDPSTGAIRGLIGSRGEHVYRGFNRSTDMKRQPGSSIKPLSVYGPALENGYKTNSLIDDVKRSFSGYTPTNLDGVYRGKVSMREALVKSINVPAVSLLNEIGVDKGVDFLRKAGIELHENDGNLSIALGGLTKGVSPLEMAQAFSVFPNLGTVNEAYAIRRITDRNGKNLFEAKTTKTSLMKPENAYAMTTMLMDVVKVGTGKNANIGRPVAGKTGTVQLPESDAFQGISGVNDAWFVGYTPELVTAVWTGYDKTTPQMVMHSSGGNHPAKIFQSIMSLALKDIPISNFEIPKGYKEEKSEKAQNKKDEFFKDILRPGKKKNKID